MHANSRQIVFLALIALALGCSPRGQKPGEVALQYDHSRFAVFSLDSVGSYETPFDPEAFSPAFLEQKDFEIIDRLLLDAVSDYNKSFPDEPPRIDFSKEDYKLQLVCVINPEGEREVWVNSFCSDRDYFDKSIVHVSDGWTCYFNFRINLTTVEYSDFSVNGAT